MSAELKACPLCKSAVEIVRDGKVCWFKCTDPKSPCIGSGLGFAFLASDEVAAITAWNTRADLTPPAADYVAGLGLKRIVEEIDGAMKHGTWRDEHGMRLKDTPEWVAFYNSLAARPASPDTRVVTMEQLRAWLEMTETPAKFANETETIRAIIGGQDRG